MQGGCVERVIKWINEQHQKNHIVGKNTYGLRTALISKDELRFDYAVQQMSLTDLGRKYNCTRQYVHKLLKHYEIERRTKSLARTLALNQGKVIFDRTNNGTAAQVILQKSHQQKVFQNVVA